MPKASPALLAALLLVLALAAPASVGGVSLLDSNTATSAPSEGVSENTTRVLRLDEIQASGFGEPSPVVLDAATMQESELDSEYSLAAVQQRLQDAPNSSVRRQILENVTETVANDVNALQQDEQRARRAYVNGEITRQQYAQQLAIIHTKATHLSRFMGERAGQGRSLYSYASTYGGIQNRISFLNEELQYLTGPIREEMAAAVQGERPPVRVFVAASDVGFELSHIRDNGVYVHSAYRSDNIDDDSTPTLAISEVEQLVLDLYPWAMDQNSSGELTNWRPTRAHGTSEILITHRHGRLTANVDDTTELVYYEVQHKRLDGLPVEYRFNRTENGTRVLVSRTYPGGPMQVRILNVTGDTPEPLGGTPVTVNGTTRNTDFNGVAWFISPNGEYNITTTVNETEFQFEGST